MSVTPEEEQALDDILADIDISVGKIIKKSDTKKLKGQTPINGFCKARINETRMAFQAMADTRIMNEEGDDILLESNDPDGPSKKKRRPTIWLGKRRASET